MKAKLHLVFSITIFFSCFCIYGQQGYWKNVSNRSGLRASSLKDISDAKKVFTLDKSGLSKTINSVSVAKSSATTVYLPNGEGDVVSVLREGSGRAPSQSFQEIPGYQIIYGNQRRW